MIRRPPRSTRTDTRFPTRRSSDLSLITDSVPAEKRSSAIAFYGLGVPVGSLLGLILGGIVNDLYGWRIALMLVGAPGLLLALVVLLLDRKSTRLNSSH